MPATHNPEAKLVSTRSELEATSSLAGMKVKKAIQKSRKLSVGGSRIISAMDEKEYEDFLDKDLSLALSRHPEAKAWSPLKEVPLDAATASQCSEAVSPPKEVQLEVIAGDKTDKPDPVPTEPGKKVVKFLPKLGLVDSSGASFKFLMELQNTIGAGREAYSEPLLLLRVEPLPEGFALPPSIASYNKAFGIDIKEKLLFIYMSGSGEDDDPNDPPLLWGSKDSLHPVDEVAKAAEG